MIIIDHPVSVNCAESFLPTCIFQQPASTCKGCTGKSALCFGPRSYVNAHSCENSSAWPSGLMPLFSHRGVRGWGRGGRNNVHAELHTCLVKCKRRAPLVDVNLMNGLQNIAGLAQKTLRFAVPPWKAC